MAFQTPPTSVRRDSRPSGSRRMPYYEDIYGKLNSDEEFDRFPDKCEEESSSEDDQASDNKLQETPRGFFKAFATPKPSDERSRLGSSQLSGAGSLHKDSQTSFKQVGKRRSASSSPSSEIEKPPTATRKLFKKSLDDRPSFPEDLNSRTANNERPPPKKLTPGKFGMFGAQSADSITDSKGVAARRSGNHTRKTSALEETAPPVENTAGEAMDDLLGGAGLDNLDDSFPTLDEDVDSAESTASDTNKPIPTLGAKSVPNENVEVNTSESEVDGTIAVKAQQSGKAKTSFGLVAVRQNRNQSIAEQLANRRSLRQQNLEKAKQATEKNARRRASSLRDTDSDASDLKALNHKKMTERAASLRSKAKKGTARTSTKRTAGRLKSSMVNHNWKGEEMDATDAIVVVPTDEEDRSEYVRY